MDRVCLCWILHSAPVKNFNGSSYIFYGSGDKGYNWDESKKSCEQSGYNLVSIESHEEWDFLSRTIRKENTFEYFIGLWKDTSIGVWRWLSDNSTMNASSTEQWPWSIDEPSGDNENCAQMYRHYRNYYGRYNDVKCSVPLARAGFICEFKGGGGNRYLIHITRNWK